MAVFGGIFAHLVLGHQYVFGTVEIYATSYLRKYDTTLTMNDTYLGIPSVVILSTIVMVLGPKMAKKFGYK